MHASVHALCATDARCGRCSRLAPHMPANSIASLQRADARLRPSAHRAQLAPLARAWLAF